MLTELLPSVARVAELYEDPPGIVLYAEEHACVARAVESRVREFATGRHCVRIALGQLGHRPTPIGKHAGGGPAWPDGIVGSITHCSGFRAAAVAREADLASVGIDAEPAEPLPDRVLEMISLPGERAELARLGGTWPGVPWDRLLFSAKESVYKAWWPLMKTFLDFEAADVGIEPEAGTFAARLLVPGPDLVQSGEFHGRFALRNGFVATAVVVGARTTGGRS